MDAGEGIGGVVILLPLVWGGLRVAWGDSIVEAS